MTSGGREPGRPRGKTARRETLILGIGNVLMGDEGVGIHAIKHLEHERLPSTVHLIDGGTGGFHLLSLFQEYDPIILIDATMDGSSAGTLHTIQPRFASDFPRTLSAHDIGLRDLIESAVLIGELPKMFLITISIDGMQSMSTRLSPPVEESLSGVAEAVHGILKGLLRH
jgi:hydrogenase maturation protease